MSSKFNDLVKAIQKADIEAASLTVLKRNIAAGSASKDAAKRIVGMASTVALCIRNAQADKDEHYNGKPPTLINTVFGTYATNPYLVAYFPELQPTDMKRGLSNVLVKSGVFTTAPAKKSVRIGFTSEAARINAKALDGVKVGKGGALASLANFK